MALFPGHMLESWEFTLQYQVDEMFSEELTDLEVKCHLFTFL